MLKCGHAPRWNREISIERTIPEPKKSFIFFHLERFFKFTPVLFLASGPVAAVGIRNVRYKVISGTDSDKVTNYGKTYSDCSPDGLCFLFRKRLRSGGSLPYRGELPRPFLGINGHAREPGCDELLLYFRCRVRF